MTAPTTQAHKYTPDMRAVEGRGYRVCECGEIKGSDIHCVTMTHPTTQPPVEGRSEKKHPTGQTTQPEQEIQKTAESIYRHCINYGEPAPEFLFKAIDQLRTKIEAQAIQAEKERIEEKLFKLSTTMAVIYPDSTDVVVSRDDVQNIII